MPTLDALSDFVIDDVIAALAIGDDTKRRTALEEIADTLFTLAEEELANEHSDIRAAAFRTMMADNLSVTAATDPDTDPEARARRISTVLAKAANGAAFVAAAEEEPQGQVTWVTMQDEAVRDTHVPMHGVTVAAGTPFIVGGHPLLYPGQPVGPPEIWMNCRCTLAVGGPLVAAGIAELPNSLVAVSDKPWSQFHASDYTIEQWRRACLLKMPGGDPESKSTYKLPVREPGGALNRNGVHAAAAALAGARGGTNAPASAKNTAKAKLRSLYKQLNEDPPDSLAADATSVVESPHEMSHSMVAVNTHDAPGWITNPRETQRLRNYWTKGAGAAKIGWGSPGDLTRCAKYISKYVAPGYVWGTCNNLHYVAMGHFNPESGGRRGSSEIDAAFAAATQLEDDVELPPLEHFTNPALSAATPYTVDPANEDHIYGHLASWETCHVGREGCVPPPRSTHDYAYFSTGEVVTAGGPVPVGQITMNTGHATEEMDPRATVAHYDDTGTVVADVAVGEDDHGIWFNGQLRPGITPEQRHALRAGALSGDWRRIGGNLELVAALAVNVPGFPIPREQLTVAASGAPMSLVAAAIVTVDPNAELADTIAALVVGKIDGRKAADERAVRASALLDLERELRVESLLSTVG